MSNNYNDGTAKSSTVGSSQQPTGWFQGLFRKRSSLGSEQPQQGRWNNRRLQRRHSAMADNNNTVAKEEEPQKINRSRSLDMAVEDKARRQRQDEEDEAQYQAIRRPSIPTSIHQRISALDKYLDDDYSSTRSNNNFDYEDQSVVSEVTLMTYSDEKANLIKEEFFKRMKRQTNKTLTLDEKKALLIEIQQDAEGIFLSRHAEIQQQKKRQTDIQKQRRISQDSNICWQDKEEVEENEDGDASIEGEQEQQNMQQRIQSSLERRKNSLAESFSSVMTAKHCNVSERHTGCHINNKANAWEATTAPKSSNNNKINFNKYYAPVSNKEAESGVGGWGEKQDAACIHEVEEEEEDV